MMPDASTRVIAGALALVALASATGTGHANAQEGRACSATTALPDDPTARDEAFALYAQSRERYSEGDFVAAVALLERAYAAYPEPVLMYNLARTLEGMARWSEAADAYACYLEREPEARDRGAIERRVEALRASAAGARGGDEASTTTAGPEASEGSELAPAPPSTGRSLEPGPFVLLGLGVASVAAGAVLGGLALDLRGQADDAAMHVDAAATFSTAEHYALAANVVWGFAGAFLVAGFVWGAIDWTTGDRSVAQIDIGLGLGGASASGRFW